jgi:hypothetical protein
MSKVSEYPNMRVGLDINNKFFVLHTEVRSTMYRQISLSIYLKKCVAEPGCKVPRILAHFGIFSVAIT